MGVKEERLLRGVANRTLTFFFKGELTLLVIVLILSTTTILTTLFVILSDACALHKSAAVAMAQTAYLSLILRHVD